MTVAQKIADYQRIEKAIEFIINHFQEQPTLEEIANSIHLSPDHFQRLFTTWAGVSPKKFLQYLSLNYAKNLLQSQTKTLFDVSVETGFSSTSRLHDLFITIEGMSPGEYKNEGLNLTISYCFSTSPFGKLLIASTGKGICALNFCMEEELALNGLKSQFSKAKFYSAEDDHQKSIVSFFQNPSIFEKSITLHLKGTPFQLKVWEALLSIPTGKLTTYGQLAKEIDNPKASRAVGTAIGTNPVAFLIPCHRVIQSTGQIGGYKWGPTRKRSILGWEAAQIDLIKEE